MLAGAFAGIAVRFASPQLQPEQRLIDVAGAFCNVSGRSLEGMKTPIKYLS